MKISVTKQSGVSLTELIEKVAAALREQFRRMGEPIFYYPEEVFDDSVIVCDSTEAKKYRIAYTVETDKVTFGEPVEVKEQYVPVEPDAQTEEVMQGVLRVKQSVDLEGWVWRIDVCEFGVSQTGDWWTPEPFQESLPLWEGIQAYADHPTETEMRELPERSIEKLVGWYGNFAVTAQSFEADFHIKQSADWLRKDIKDAFEQGNKTFLGFSLILLGTVKQAKAPDGKTVKLWTRIIKPGSIDVVTKAAAGGKVKYALASNRGPQISEGAMNMNKKALALLLKQSKQRFAFVRQSMVTASAKGVTAEMNEDQLAEAIYGDEALVTQAVDLFEKEPEPATAVQSNRNQPGAEEGEIPFARLPQAVRQSLINEAISDSGLPEAVQQSLRQKVTATSTLDQVNAQIESTREAIALVSQSGQVNNGRIVTFNAGSLDKITIGLAKTFGLTREQFEGTPSYIEQEVRQSGRTPFRPSQSEWDDVPEIHSIKMLYFDMTGDRQMNGIRNRTGRLVRQSQTPYQTSDFPDLLSNLMHKRIIASFRENDYGLSRVTVKRSLDDFKPQQIIIIGYYGDLPTVTENGEYTTYAALTDDKETYSPLKRGKTVDLTLETVANDDTKTLRQVPERMGRAARRTLAKFVWVDNLFANPTLNRDSKALFHADHNNLITDPLGNTGLKNGIGKLLMQTEPGSGEKFSFSLDDLTLAVRSDNILDAMTLTDFNQEPGGNASALDRLLRSAGGRVKINPVALPFLTDPNDWMLTASNKEADIVEIGYWMGNEEPEFFEMMGETHEKAFNNDVITRHKCRFIFGGASCGFEPVVKSQVVDN